MSARRCRARKKSGVSGGTHGQVGRNWNNGANAGPFNAYAYYSSSNANANIGAHHQGNTIPPEIPYHSVKIQSKWPGQQSCLLSRHLSLKK